MTDQQEPRYSHSKRTDDPGQCTETHRFSPRDGWRLICGSCDHLKNAPCHI